MAYKVNELAKLSEVSVRTLHFYDEIGLLIPAYIGPNGYRFYEEQQLLILQQILFFKELGFELAQIKKIIGQNDFDIMNSLEQHRQVLLHKKKRMQDLIKTVDKTIKRIKGEIKMKDKEIYYGFRPAKQDEYEQYWIDSGAVTKDQITAGNERLKQWNKADWQRLMREGEDINALLVKAIESGLKPDAGPVQELVARHYEMIKLFWEPQIRADKERYSGLGLFYVEHDEMKKYYDKFHSRLAEFLAQAIKVFADKNL
jgi:DNA-binding transcriptional MerR regulator